MIDGPPEENAPTLGLGGDLVSSAAPTEQSATAARSQALVPVLAPGAKRHGRDFVPPKRSRPREGDFFDGVYRVESFIARGGFAEICAVRHERRRHACVLKVLRADKETPANRGADLIDEARTIDALPATDSFVSMFDCAVDPARGIPCVVMELLI